ncbi:hypothetical protein ACN26P_003341 [Vibrio cholerae]|nr:hypothetical protein [Vibrio cholerae]
MMQYLDQRIDALKKQLANEAPEVKAINEPAYRFAIRELELAKSAFNKSKPSSDDDVTRYIVCTAHHFCGEQHGEDFARRMLLEAGVSMENANDARVVASLGDDYVETVRRLTK